MRLEIGLTSDLVTCQAIRRVVFIEEQGVSLADEVDGRDGEAEHLLALLDGQPVGTARMLVAGETGKIGRVAVLAAARGQGIGAALIRAAVDAPAGAGAAGRQAGGADPGGRVLRGAGVRGLRAGL